MTLRDFLAAHDAVIRARLTRVRGSAPREQGAEMLVAADAMFGTIGGGRLELTVAEAARRMLADGAAAETVDLPLGPEIGQCCGGRVEIALERLTEVMRKEALAQDDWAAAQAPEALILGAGHVGRALAAALCLLPLRVRLVDSRAAELAKLDPAVAAKVEIRLTALPEAEIRAARPGAAFIVATHDHALDFLLAGEALARGDAAYAGLIGSATKRAAFAAHTRREGLDPAPLVCPIGAGAPDKRPEVIAAFTAAEVMAALTTAGAAVRSGGAGRLGGGVAAGGGR